MNQKEFEDAIYTVFRRWLQVSYPEPASSDQDYVEVFWAERAAPQPKPPFVTLNLITGPRKDGWDDLIQRQQIQTLTFSASLVTANVINGNVGVDAISPVTFVSNHASTLAVLCQRLKASGVINHAVINPSNPLQIIVYSSSTVSLTGFVVTLGATQPTITVAETQSNDELELSGIRTVTISVQAFGCNRVGGIGTGAIRYTAMDILERLQGALELPDFIEDLGRWGFGVGTSSDPADLTGIIETKFEMRAQMDIMITLPYNRSSSAGFIETAEIEGVGNIIEGVEISGP